MSMKSCKLVNDLHKWAMQVEIKLRLASREAHDRVAAALSAAHQATHQQENFFFDGSRQELTSSQSVLRCRFYNTDKRALLTCKVHNCYLLQRDPPCRLRYNDCPMHEHAASSAPTLLLPSIAQGKQELVGGIGRGTELETDIDPIKARELLQHPDGLLQLKIDFVDNLCRCLPRFCVLACSHSSMQCWCMRPDLPISMMEGMCQALLMCLLLRHALVLAVCSKLGVQSLVSLGGFKNVRQDFSWEGFKLELDETQFDWGTVYEIEVETVCLLSCVMHVLCGASITGSRHMHTLSVLLNTEMHCMTYVL